MCCRIDVSDFPSDPTLSQIMAIGGFFELGSQAPAYRRFMREFGHDERGHRRNLTVQFFDRADLHVAKFELAPTIGHHTHEDHYRNRDMGAIAMKVAQTLAETSNAKIIQRALMGDCEENDDGQRELANYPDKPLLFEHMCFGWRDVLGAGVYQERPGQEDEPEL